MLEENEDTIFLQSVANQIEGWLVDYAARVTQQLLRKQEQEGGNAPLLEIGIYAGKYLSLLMASAGRTNSKVIGIDTFQHQPIEVVKENVSKFMPELASILIIFPEPSHAFPPDRLIKVLGGKARCYQHRWVT
jgi:hypothetical protein